MDISQMHEMFRTVGQQVGMQDVRAILPESIDIFINIYFCNLILKYT